MRELGIELRSMRSAHQSLGSDVQSGTQTGNEMTRVAIAASTVNTEADHQPLRQTLIGNDLQIFRLSDVCLL